MSPVLESRLQAMLAAKYAVLNWGFVRHYLLRMRWRSIEHIGHISLPILFMVGRDAAEMQPRCSRDTVEMQPRYSRDTHLAANPLHGRRDGR